ncbi:unnamed protein product [Arctia plantaginis]|uniref:Uncharacterized protein n=1 Tax=Arctia plantaginis TaxID=874455 RepID=A0A8S0ZDV5_ARCPL|nr:unnamed protein product [Arctia plantaginis]CAB3249834.1 unnamed protein product [Arctia plantaginis]
MRRSSDIQVGASGPNHLCLTLQTYRSLLMLKTFPSNFGNRCVEVAVRGHRGAARVVIGARVRCTEQRESHKHKRSRRATDGRQVARRGDCHCARTPRPALAPRSTSPRVRRQPAALSRRTSRRFLSPHAVASFSPLPHFRPPRQNV